MNHDTLMNVIRVNQTGSITIHDSADCLSWDSPFSIVTQVMFLSSPDYSILFEKNGLLKLELLDGYLAVSGSGIPDTVVSFAIGEASLNEYQMFSITYCRSTLRVFHNSTLILMLSVDKNGISSSTDPIVLGDSFEGYISYFRVFDRAISSFEICEQSNMFTASDYEDLVMELSAVTGEIICDPHELTIVNCEACNLLPCFAFSRYGNIRIIDDERVNPGGRFIRDSLTDDSTDVTVRGVEPYSVVAAIYFIPGSQQRYYIFSNCDNVNDSGMSIYIEKDTDGYHYIYAKLGNSSQNERLVRSAEPIPEKQWVHVSNTYSNGTLKLHIEHQLSTSNEISIDDAFVEQSSKCTIGDISGNVELLDEKNFSGYIKYVFVFNEALSDEESLISNLGDIYAKDSLVGAYEAQSMQEKNQVSSADIYMSRGVSSLLLENSLECVDLRMKKAFGNRQAGASRDYFGVKVWSVRENGQIIFKYLSPDEGEIIIDCIDEVGISEETEWLIEGLLIVIIGVMTIVAGLKVSTAGKAKVTKSLIELIGNPYMKTAIQLLCKNVSWANMLNLFKVIYQTGFLKTIILGLFELSWQNVISTIMSIVGMISGTKVAGVVVTIGVIFIPTVILWVQKYPGHKKKSSIHLSKVIFLHEKEDGSIDPSESAVFLQANYNQREADYYHIAIKDHEARKKNNVLYISNCINGKVSVKAEFIVEGDESFEVSVEEKNSRYDLKSMPVTITQTNCSGYFDFPSFRFDTGVLERSDITLVWRGRIGDGEEFVIAETSHRLYFLPSEPTNPICVTQANQILQAPITTILDYYFDYIERNQEEKQNDIKIQIVKAINNSTKLMYISERRFGFHTCESGIELFGISVNSYFNALNREGNKTEVNCQDVTALSLYLLYVFGDTKCVGAMRIRPKGAESFAYKSILVIGETDNRSEGIFTEHWVMVDMADYSAEDSRYYLVYDGCLRYHTMVDMSNGTALVKHQRKWLSGSTLVNPVETHFCVDAANTSMRKIASYIRNLTQSSDEIDHSTYCLTAIVNFEIDD